MTKGVKWSYEYCVSLASLLPKLTASQGPSGQAGGESVWRWEVTPLLCCVKCLEECPVIALLHIPSDRTLTFQGWTGREARPRPSSLGHIHCLQGRSLTLATWTHMARRAWATEIPCLSSHVLLPS